MIYVTRKAHFNAAHRLHNPAQSDEWNRETYGKCNHPNWHGHNYLLEVVVAGEPDPETGYVIDLGKLYDIIEEQVISLCDHKNLNCDVPFLSGINPTSENLVKAFYERLRGPVEMAAAAGCRLYAVRLHETARNMAEYRISAG